MTRSDVHSPGYRHFPRRFQEKSNSVTFYTHSSPERAVSFLLLLGTHPGRTASQDACCQLSGTESMCTRWHESTLNNHGDNQSPNIQVRYGARQLVMAFIEKTLSSSTACF